MNNDDDADDTGDDADFGDDIVGLFYDNEILYFTCWCKIKQEQFHPVS